jgi:hypothetical protein
MDSVRQVAVKSEIRGKYGDMVTVYDFLDLIDGNAHLDSESLNLVAA